jgi:hypothetical protein
MDNRTKILAIGASLLLYYTLFLDFTLHNGPSRIMIFLVPVLTLPLFLSIWSTLLWNKPEKASPTEKASLVVLLIAMSAFATTNLTLFAIIIGLHYTILLLSFVFVRTIGIERFRSIVRWAFYVLILPSAFISVRNLSIETDGKGVIFHNILRHNLFGEIILVLLLLSTPFLVILFPVFVLDLLSSSGKRRIFSAVVAAIFAAIAFIGSNYGKDIVRKIQDPCYRVIEGKSPTHIVRKDRVCITYYENGSGTSYYKTLEGADPNTFKKQ